MAHVPSIESSGFPLVFKLARDSIASNADSAVIQTCVRALEGMQKEAIVTCGPGGDAWRLACDEGPYLNGKDMAPFPLSFFSAGMQFSFLSRFLQAAQTHNVSLEAVSLDQDNFYSMEGSFLRGDARGGAKSAELRLKVESSATASKITELARMAEASSEAQVLMRTPITNTFALTLNGRPRDIPELPASPSSKDDPAPRFQAAAPAPEDFLPDIITRVKKGETVHGVEGGAGSSLKSEQKRTLHIHGEARWISDLLMETVIHLYKPIGSSYRFVCDENGSAPPPLAYLSAGIGFCYMTQLGRYAHIVKQKLDGYRIIQEDLGPVDTQVFLESDYADESDASKLVSMGQQTCFLHAAMRGEYPCRLAVLLNGKEV